MPLESQVVSVAFGQGLDSKTDPKVTAKPVLIQDGIFTNPRRISKRNGYTSLTLNILSGGTISSPTMSRSYKNELVCAGTTSGGASNGNRLFSYSSSLGLWVDKGKYNSVAVSKQVVAAPETGWIAASNPAQILGLSNASGAVIGNITLLSYEASIPSLTPAVTSLYFTAIDNQTGTLIAPQTTITSALGYVWGYSKTVALGTNLFAVFYIADVAIVKTTPTLCYKTISITNAGIVVGSEVQLHACSAATGSDYIYDVSTTPGGCLVALTNTVSGHLYTINTAGAVVLGPVSLGYVATNFSPITIQLDATSTNAWIYWGDNNTSVHYAIFNASTLATVLSHTLIANTAVRQIAAVPVTSTDQKAYYSILSTPATSLTIGVYQPNINEADVTSAGSVSVNANNPVIRGVDIYTKTFTGGGASLMGCVSVSQSDPVGFLIDTSDNTAVAKFLPGEAEAVYSQGANTTGAAYSAPSIVAMRHPGFINPVMTNSSTLFSLPCGFVVSLIESIPTSSSSLGAFPAALTQNATMGVCIESFDFNSIDAHQAIIQQDTLVLNGAVVSQYDGASVTELGFSTDPDNVSILGAGTAGNLGTGKYIYYIVYQWTDANGNLHQSAPSPDVCINFTAGTTNKATVGWAPLSITQKTSITANIYRTLANGTVAYLVASVSNSAYGWGNTFPAYIDTSSDDSIKANARLYTQGGAILENLAPPPSMILWTGQNRIWCIDSENPESTIEYSKTASKGSGIAFSTGFLEVVIDSSGGAISGARPMDEKTVILKKNAVGYFIGDGANDAGGGSTITSFQFIPSDTGCSNSSSVILYPNGILFKASNNKGIYQVNRGTNVNYFGTDVEAYNSQDIRSALIVPNLNQIRFLTSSGSSLLYDYVMNQWSVFTNHAGVSSDSFNGLYVYVRSDGLIYQENTTTFLDGATPYAPIVKLQFIKAASVQNFQRLKRIALLGDYQNGSSAGHGVQISAAYDFGTAFSTPIAYTFGASSSSGSFQYRERLPRQKCDSIQLLIQEVTTGASGEFIDFTDLGLEIAVKRGLNKLPASRSV